MKPDDMPFMSTSSLYTDSNYMHCSINGENKTKIYFYRCPILHVWLYTIL